MKAMEIDDSCDPRRGGVVAANTLRTRGILTDGDYQIGSMELMGQQNEYVQFAPLALSKRLRLSVLLTYNSRAPAAY